MCTPVIDIPSPCVGICTLNSATDLCAGCMRTREEIAKWSSFTNEDRFVVVQKLRERRRAAGITSFADQKTRRRKR